jgi:hypothetical protein
MFGAYMLRIDISSGWIVPLINMKWPSLSLQTDFSLKSALSDIIIATLFCLQGSFVWKTFFPSFDSRPVLAFLSEMCLL